MVGGVRGVAGERREDGGRWHLGKGLRIDVAAGQLGLPRDTTGQTQTNKSDFQLKLRWS